MGTGAETARKLREMGAGCLLDALAAQDEDVCIGIPFATRVQMAVDETHSDFVIGKAGNLVKRARMRCPDADIWSLDFDERRGLGGAALAQIAM